jgi:hypothetical protein
MAEFLVAKPSAFTPNIIFGPAVGGYHAPLFREGAANTHTLADLETLSSSPNIIIGFKEKGFSRVARYEFGSKAFSNLLIAFEDRIKEISNLTPVWSPNSSISIHSNRPSIPCDREFLSQYVLVGNIDPNAFRSLESLASLKKKIMVCCSTGDIPGTDSEDLSHLDALNVGHIRPSSLGFEDHPCVRSMKVIKLSKPARVGITMSGGLRITERIHVNTDAPS